MRWGNGLDSLLLRNFRQVKLRCLYLRGRNVVRAGALFVGIWLSGFREFGNILICATAHAYGGVK